MGSFIPGDDHKTPICQFQKTIWLQEIRSRRSCNLKFIGQETITLSPLPLRNVTSMVLSVFAADTITDKIENLYSYRATKVGAHEDQPTPKRTRRILINLKGNTKTGIASFMLEYVKNCILELCRLYLLLKTPDIPT